jgi:hypothetical protein
LGQSNSHGEASPEERYDRCPQNIRSSRERERNVEHNAQWERLHHGAVGGPQSLVVNSVPKDKSELRPSARVFEEMRESDHSPACEEDSPRERGP